MPNCFIYSSGGGKRILTNQYKFVIMLLISIIIISINLNIKQWNNQPCFNFIRRNIVNPPTIEQAIDAYIDNVALARSNNTARSYRNAVNAFTALLLNKNISIQETPVDQLSETTISWFAAALKDYAPATEQLYLTAIAGFFEFLAAERMADPNLPRLRLLIRQRARKPGQRLPQFPRNEIDTVLDHAINIANSPVENNSEYLRNLRDRAFLLVLADTGLRVHEAVGLRRGDMDWNEGKAIIVGKGNRQSVIRFSTRCMNALKNYLNARGQLDGNSGRPLASLPLFARHDRGAGKKIKPITTATGRNIVNQRVKEALGSEAVGKITPHSFRHYFVTTVLRASGGNLKLAQELARHRNITVTQRYAHLSDDELDKGYWEIFEK
jgi:integrase/recombinase XerC